MSGPAPNRPDPAQLLRSMPFAGKLGIHLDAAAPDQVTGRLRWATELCTLDGIMHGGALMALADTVGALCAFLNLPPGAATATISSASNLLRPVRGGEVTATARPLSVGMTVIVVRTELHGPGGALVAQVTQTQAVLHPRSG